MTSAEDFPEELMVPPLILNTPELSQGDIITFDQSRDTDLRLVLTVNDGNIDQDLRMRAKLSVRSEKPQAVCQADPIPVSGLPQRTAPLILSPTMLRPGSCTKVEVFVSEKFVGRCDDDDLSDFEEPSVPNDLATASYWIWEMSRDPAGNPVAAQEIVSTCLTVPRASGVLPPPP